MKQLFLGILLSSMSFYGFSQTIETFSTDDGDKVIAINSDSTSEISFTTTEWADISSTAASQSPQQICIVIATRPNCNHGIGFRCGVFDCPPPVKNPSLNSRVQPVIYSLDHHGNVHVTFINPIDWTWLANN